LDCGPSCATRAAAVQRDRPRARCERRNDKTVWTRAGRRRLGAEHSARPLKYPSERAGHRTRSLLFAALRKWIHTPDRVAPSSGFVPAPVLVPTCEQLLVLDPSVASAR